MKPTPLHGIRVVDFGWVWAGAIPGQLLGDLGAEVIKVETRTRLDFMRQGRPIRGTVPDPEQNPMFHAVNRNKLSITVDIRNPETPPLLRRLIAVSDIVIENFAPGFLAKHGLDYAALREVRPDLIMLSVSTAGQTGPLRDIRGYATIIAALSGLDGLVGYPGEEPIGMQQPYSDPNGSLHGLLAVLAALHHRRRTGEGQYIDLSMTEAAVAVMGEAVMEYTLAGRVATPQGNRHPGMAPHGHYPVAEPDAWVSIVVGTEAEWAALRGAMGDPAWAAAPEFADASQRLRHQPELDAQLAAWTRRHPQRALVELLQRAGVAAAPVLGPAERAVDPHFQARGTYAPVEHPVLGEEMIYTLPWKMRRHASVLRRAPLLGEHNAYVFADLLGLSAEEIAGLTERGVIA